MPKTPSVILREKLRRKGIELLDIYHGREKDIVRFKTVIDGKVYLYEIKQHVRDMVKEEDIDKLVEEIVNSIKK